MAGRLGTVDLAAAHQSVLRRLLADLPDGVSETDVANRGMQFLLEALSPFEMTLRGFRDAVQRLEHEVAERTRAEEALRIAHDHLEERVRQRTAELSAANERLRLEAAERERAEQALRETEHSYEALVANVRDYAIFMVDPDGTVASWNPGAQRIKGYGPEEIVGRHVSVFYTPEDQQNDRPREVLARAIAEGSYEEEGWRVRKDGSRFWADTAVTALRAEDGTLRGFTKVTRDITDRRRAQQALEDLNAQLQQANEEKDQFVAMISHELRNPLSAVLSGVEVLFRTLPPDAGSRRALEIIQRNATLQKRLVNDLLDLSRLTRDRLPLQHAPVALDSIARSVVTGEEREAARAGLALSVDAGPGLWVLGDADRLQQVLLNLVGNAIKFTPSGGRIDVKVFRAAGDVETAGLAASPAAVDAADPPGQPGCICLVVEDTGIGIDRALLARLFEPFQQGDIASHRQHGLGLGLALVKLITEKHSGRVRAESKGPNQGSRFVVALPALQVEPALERAHGDRARRLLLVEGNPDTRALVAANLESSGYQVATAGTCEEALLALATRPDLILCDVGLPGTNGFEFLQKARQVEGAADIPAFAVIASGSGEDWRRVRQAGFAGHFVKPIDVRALDTAIRAWFEAARK